MILGRRNLLNSTALAGLGLAMLSLGTPALANPTDGQVVAGQATITAPDPSTLMIQQHSQNVVLEWGSFDIAPGETTTFVQPNSHAWALNRVVGSQDPSVIAGALNANGNIAIVNPDGIVFSQGARIDVGGLVASTADIDTSAFMRGDLRFNLPGNPAASVINEGTISVRDYGLAAFVAPGVRNSGVITARLGTLSLASGNTFTLDLYGDGLVSLAIGDEITEEVIDVATGEVMSDLVKNEGILRANGGTVALTAATARTAVNSVINNTGVIEAKSVGMREGKIILGAQTATSKPDAAPPQTVQVSGSLNARAVRTSLRPKARPGSIQITGEDIAITGATIDASGTDGAGTILVGGDYLGGQKISDFFPLGEEIREDHEIPTATTLTLDDGTTLRASALETGDGGKIILWSDQATTTSATILALGAPDGKGGFIETSSAGTLSLPEGSVSAGQGGMWLLDPRYLIIHDFDAQFSDTRYVSANAISSALNRGTNVQLQATDGLEAGLSVNDDIIKTSGGDAQLLLGSTGSIAINADIRSLSGKLDVGIVTAARSTQTARVGLTGTLANGKTGSSSVGRGGTPSVGTLYVPLPSGQFRLMSGNTINTNGGDFLFRGASFQAQSDLVFRDGSLIANAAPGRIVTEGGRIGLFFPPASVSGSSDNGFIGCYNVEIACSTGSNFTLDADRGPVVVSLDTRYALARSQDAPKLFVNDYGIRTKSRLNVNNVVLRPFGFAEPNGISNIAFGSVSKLNNAALTFHSQDIEGVANTPPVLRRSNLPDVTLRPGDSWAGLNFRDLFADNDGFENLTISLDGSPNGLPVSFVNSSAVAFNQITGFSEGDIAPGRYAITLTATDGFNPPASLSFQLVVANPPVTLPDRGPSVAVEDPAATDRFRPDNSIDDRTEIVLDAILEGKEISEDALDILTGNDFSSLVDLALGRSTSDALAGSLTTREGQNALDDLIGVLFDQNSNLSRDSALKVKEILEKAFDVEITSDVGNASELLDIAMKTRSKAALMGNINGIQMAILSKSMERLAEAEQAKLPEQIERIYTYIRDPDAFTILCPDGCSLADGITTALSGSISGGNGYARAVVKARGQIEASISAIAGGSLVGLGKELMFGTTHDDEIMIQDLMVTRLTEERNFDNLRKFSEGDVFSLEPKAFGLGVREVKVPFKERYPEVYEILQGN